MSVKKCSGCRKSKSLDFFDKHPTAGHGRSNYCKECRKEYGKERLKTPEGKAQRAWWSMKGRVKNQSEYIGVEIRFTRKEFMAWAVPAFTEWMSQNPGLRPSVDRINVPGHYEIGNVRVLELGENCRLAAKNKNVHAPDGKAWCGSCKKYKLCEQFEKNRSTPHGLQSRCRKCRAAQRVKSINPNWKNHAAPEGRLWCGGCNLYLITDDFYKCKTTKTGYQTSCKGCQSERSRQQRLNKQ